MFVRLFVRSPFASEASKTKSTAGDRILGPQGPEILVKHICNSLSKLVTRFIFGNISCLISVNFNCHQPICFVYCILFCNISCIIIVNVDYQQSMYTFYCFLQQQFLKLSTILACVTLGPALVYCNFDKVGQVRFLRGRR